MQFMNEEMLYLTVHSMNGFGCLMPISQNNLMGPTYSKNIPFN